MGDNSSAYFSIFNQHITAALIIFVGFISSSTWVFSIAVYFTVLKWKVFQIEIRRVSSLVSVSYFGRSWTRFVFPLNFFSELIVSITSLFSALLSFIFVSNSASGVGITLSRIVEDSDVHSSGWIVGGESTFNSVSDGGSAEVDGYLVDNSTTDGGFGVILLKYNSNLFIWWTSQIWISPRGFNICIRLFIMT